MTTDRKPGAAAMGVNDPDVAALMATDYAPLLTAIAEGMRYDADLEAIVIPVPNTPDESFPHDESLRNGPLTLATWSMALSELADLLPPWGEEDLGKAYLKRVTQDRELTEQDQADIRGLLDQNRGTP